MSVSRTCHAVTHAVTHSPVTPLVTVPPTRPDPTRPVKTFPTLPNVQFSRNCRGRKNRALAFDDPYPTAAVVTNRLKFESRPQTARARVARHDPKRGPMTVKLPPSCNCPTCTARTGTGASRTPEQKAAIRAAVAAGRAELARIEQISEARP